MTDLSGELYARVEEYERTWNSHEASAVAAFFAEDADMLFGNEPIRSGRDAIRDWWADYFDLIEAARGGTFAIESLRLITADVALLNVASTTAGRGVAGQGLSTRLARGTWVMVRRAGVWWIASLRGLPAEGDVRAGPGRDLDSEPATTQDLGHG